MCELLSNTTDMVMRHDSHLEEKREHLRQAAMKATSQRKMGETAPGEANHRARRLARLLRFPVQGGEVCLSVVRLAVGESH